MVFDKLSNTQRIALNTSAQYVRTIINTLLSFYSTRLILSALGVEDFGIYSLISSVIAFLSFITNSLTTTTQRYLNIFSGKGDITKVHQIFHNSLIIHLILGVVVVGIIELIGLFLFDGFLNIPKERILAGKVVYHCVSIMVLFTFVTSPFRALLISHENIIYISIVDVIDGVLRVIVAILLINISYDKLMTYGILMIGVPVFNFIAFASFCIKQYSECQTFSFKNFNVSFIKELSSFASWIIYGTGCVVARTQGIAILFNQFVGTVANAAFGIALQVSSAITFISSSLLTAINPQLMKTEGASNRAKMLQYAETASKFACLLLAMIVIPCIYEMPYLLHLWLGNAPEYTVMLCRMILLTALIDQLTTGLGSANQAIGNIRSYSLVFYTIKLLTLPTAYICLRYTNSLFYAMICYVVFEFISALIRLPYLQRTGGLSVQKYIKNVFVKITIPLITLLSLCWLVWMLFDSSLARLIVIFFIPNMIYIIVVYQYGLIKEEKMIFGNYIQLLTKHLCKR